MEINKLTVEEFLYHIDELPLNWDYFSDFNKINDLDKYLKEIEQLNNLLGMDSSKIDTELLKIVKKYPKSIDVLLLMIALRANKVKDLNIYSPYEKDKNISMLKQLKTNKDEVLYFFKMSGLKKIFIANKVGNLYGYLIGVTIGLDTNGRKNRTGKLMESVCETYIKEFCIKHGYHYYSQTSINNLNVNKKFDFITNTGNKFIVIEVNNYNTSGSKIKSVSEEYIRLDKLIPKDKISFVWITNGNGWIKNKGLITKNLNNIEHFINFKQFKDGYLETLI